MKKILIFGLASMITFSCVNKETAHKHENNYQNAPETREDLKISGTREKLIGDWQMSYSNREELSDGEKSIVLTFTKEGKAKNNMFEGEAKWELISKNGKEYIDIQDGEASNPEMQIISISDKELVLLTSEGELGFKKK